MYLLLDFAVTMSDAASFDAALKHIDLMLNKHGRSTNQFGLPKTYTMATLSLAASSMVSTGQSRLNSLSPYYLN